MIYKYIIDPNNLENVLKIDPIIGNFYYETANNLTSIYQIDAEHNSGEINSIKDKPPVALG